jgi:hypothetical protein
MLHNATVHAEAAKLLPGLVETLSRPTQPMSQDQLLRLFATNPHNRRTIWKCLYTDDGGIKFSSAIYDHREGNTRSIDPGLDYTFDPSGRLVNIKFLWDVGIRDPRPYSEETLTYDAQGYLTRRTTWGAVVGNHPMWDTLPEVIEQFEYVVDKAESKIPTSMLRYMPLGKTMDRLSAQYSDPMLVDLANHQAWLAKNAEEQMYRHGNWLVNE